MCIKPNKNLRLHIHFLSRFPTCIKMNFLPTAQLLMNLLVTIPDNCSNMEEKASQLQTISVLENSKAAW